MALLLVSASLGRIDTFNLASADILVVNLEHVEVLLLAIESVLVHADDDFSSRIYLGLSTRRTLFNPHLRHAGDDGLGHTAEIFNFIDDLASLSRELVRQSLHHMRAGPRVSHVRDASLFLNDQLGVARDSC